MRHCGDSKIRSKDCICITCENDCCVCSYGKLCLRCLVYEEDAYNDSCNHYYTWTDKIRGKTKSFYFDRWTKFYSYVITEGSDTDHKYYKANIKEYEQALKELKGKDK